jgi:hypothetical protein
MLGSIVVLFPHDIPTFLDGLELATSITRNTLDSFKFRSFTISHVTSVPEAPTNDASSIL